MVGLAVDASWTRPARRHRATEPAACDGTPARTVFGHCEIRDAPLLFR